MHFYVPVISTTCILYVYFVTIFIFFLNKDNVNVNMLIIFWYRPLLGTLIVVLIQKICLKMHFINFENSHCNKNISKHNYLLQYDNLSLHSKNDTGLLQIISKALSKFLIKQTKEARGDNFLNIQIIDIHQVK
jgi:hypothetical protein